MALLPPRLLLLGALALGALLLVALVVPLAVWAPAAKAPPGQVTVGVVLPGRNLRYPFAWPRVAPALSLALEALQSQLTLDGISVRTAFASNEDGRGKCDPDERLSALKAEDLKGSDDPDVLLGLSCFAHSYLLEPKAESWGLPILRAGPYVRSSSLPGEVYAGPLGPSLIAFRTLLLQHFNWTGRAVIVVKAPLDTSYYYCDFSFDESQGQPASEGPDVYVPRHVYFDPDEAIRYIQAEGPVAFICGPLEDLHQIMLLAHAQNMTNGNYLFFYLDPFGGSLRAVGHREAAKPWQSSKTQDTECLQEAFQRVLVITPREPQTPEYRRFENQLVLRAQREFGVALNDSLGHMVAGCYHDLLLLYLMALNETLHEGGTKRDTDRILEHMRSLKIQGVTGTVSINSDNDREMDFVLWSMRDVESGEFQVVSHYIASEDQIKSTGPIVWKNGGPPLHKTSCVKHEFVQG